MQQAVGNLDITRQLQRLLDVRGQLQLALGADILPVVNAFDLDNPPFHSKRGAIATVGFIATAAQYARVRIANTGPEGTVVVVRYVDIVTMAADFVGLGFQNTSVPLANNTTGLPSWDNGGKTSDVEMSYESQGAPLARTQLFVTQARTPYRVVGPYVIRRGNALDIGSGVQAGEQYITLYADIYDNS